MVKALVLGVVLLFSMNTYADYFKGGVGYSLGGEIGGSSTEDLDSAPLFPLLAAYGFEMYDQLNGEVEVSYRNNEYKDNNDFKASALNVAFNVVGGVPVGPAVITGGLGVNFGSYDSGISGLDTGTAFGVQVFGGADFKLQENITLGGELRYMTTITDIDFGQGIDNGKYNNTALLFVAKFAL